MARGRPKGVKNRPKEVIQAEREQKSMMPKRGRGRPVGSKNRVKEPEPVIEEPVKKKTGRPKGSKSSYTMSDKALMQRVDRLATRHPRNDEEREYNARLIEHIMQTHAIGENADRHDLLSLRSCFLSYIKLCQTDGFNVTNLSAYASMGMDHTTFRHFSLKDDPEIKAFCKFVKETCAMFRENMIANNKLNPVMGIFWQRNFDGLRNDTEQVQAIQEQDDDYSRNGSYKDKYRKLIGGD